MNESVLLLYLLNLLFIGILPYVFFKKDGRKNSMWWITAAPFFLCTFFLLASYFKVLLPVTTYSNFWSIRNELISVPFSVASISLIAFTLGTHRIPLSLWHQENDAPQHIVTYGAYEKIRHPFYTAFLLALLGALIFCPQAGTLFTFVYGLLMLNFTAAREEKRLLASQLKEQYKAYIQHTGRFFPRWKGN